LSNGSGNSNRPSFNSGERLFSAFAHPAHDEWRRAAERSLKGRSFGSLFTKTYEGITLEPVYCPENVGAMPHLGGLPGFAPYVRGTHPVRDQDTPWVVCQEIRCAQPEAVNRALRRDLSVGQTAVSIVLDRAGFRGCDPDTAESGELGQGGVSIVSLRDVEQIFKGLDPTEYPVFIQAGSASVPLAALLFAALNSQGVELAQLTGAIAVDPLDCLVRDGALNRSLENQFDEMAALCRFADERAPGFRTIGISSHPYHDSGASAVDELACAIATGVTYLAALVERGVPVDQAAGQCRFSFSVGTFFFMEVAKLRAARLLWSQAVSAFGGSAAAGKMAMHARSSTREMTLHDPHTNILRGTTETFAAVLGGADSIHTSPFDELTGESDAFSRRVARNTQVVMNLENHVGQVLDPSGGSWYVEHLTHVIGKNAWARFQEIEKCGGMAQALLDGVPQAMIAETAEARRRDVATRKTAVIGTNFFSNKDEKVAFPTSADEANEGRDKILARLVEHRASRSEEAVQRGLALAEQAPPDGIVAALIDAGSAGATLGEMVRALNTEGGTVVAAVPLPIRRTAEIYEKLRAVSTRFREKTGQRPQVYLGTVGPAPKLRARIDFSIDFFEVGGFEVRVGSAFNSPEQAAEAACESAASIVVLCATDEAYTTAVPTFAGIVKERTEGVTVIMAGHPGDQEKRYREIGVDEFIHLRANNYAILLALLEGMGA
jgi:methylmalonyl-CoA mutase